MARRKRLTRRRRSRQFRGRQRFKTMRRRVKRGRIRRYTKVGKFRGGTSKQISRRCRNYCRRKGKRGGMQSTEGGNNCYEVCLKGLKGAADNPTTKGGSLDQAINDGKINKVEDLNQQNALDGFIAEVKQRVNEAGIEEKLKALNTANTEINKLMTGGSKNDIKEFVQWTEAAKNLTNAATDSAVWDNGNALKTKADAAIKLITFTDDHVKLLKQIATDSVYDASYFKQYVEILTKFESITWPSKPDGS